MPSYVVRHRDCPACTRLPRANREGGVGQLGSAGRIGSMVECDDDQTEPTVSVMRRRGDVLKYMDGIRREASEGRGYAPGSAKSTNRLCSERRGPSTYDVDIKERSPSVRQLQSVEIREGSACHEVTTNWGFQLEVPL